MSYHRQRLVFIRKHQLCLLPHGEATTWLHKKMRAFSFLTIHDFHLSFSFSHLVVRENESESGGQTEQRNAADAPLAGELESVKVCSLLFSYPPLAPLTIVDQAKCTRLTLTHRQFSSELSNTCMLGLSVNTWNFRASWAMHGWWICFTSFVRITKLVREGENGAHFFATIAFPQSTLKEAKSVARWGYSSESFVHFGW